MRMIVLNTQDTQIIDDKQLTENEVDAAVAGGLATNEPFSVVTAVEYRPERNPFQVYLARLGHGSRPTMADALERIARIASGGTLEAAAFPWTACDTRTSQRCVLRSWRASQRELGSLSVLRQ